MMRMDELLCKLLWVQLYLAGIFREKQFDLAGIKSNNGLGGIYDQWLKESLTILAQHNYLSFDGVHGELTDPAPVNPEAVWHEWDQTKSAWLKLPDLKAQVVLVEATLRALPEILTGKVPATDIMFPGSSMKLVEGIYKHNKVADYFNKVIADLVVAYLKERLQLDRSARIRIMEIGAGTGGTSAGVLQQLKPFQEQIEEYCYTDISKAFLSFAQEEYGAENPYLTYKIFNVEAPVGNQEIGAGEYDLVIAANVLHATKNIRQTLRNAKAVLRRNGLILLNELSDKSLFTHLTFGLLEGWWLYEDPELRIPGCPGLTAESWRQVLEAEGFRSVFFPAEAAHHLGQQIVVAESDGVIHQTTDYSLPIVAPGTNQTRLSPNSTSLKNPPPRSLEAGEKLSPPPTPTIQAADNSNVQAIEGYVKEKITENLSVALKVKSEMIDTDQSFADYGVDSIIGVNLVQAINRALRIDLQTTDIFDYSSVNQLTRHILSKFKPDLAAALGGPKPIVKPSLPNSDQSIVVPGEQRELVDQRPVLKNFRKKGFYAGDAPRGSGDAAAKTQRDPIAIIGMSGRFAQSRTVDELWQHLAAGEDLVGKVNRWDLAKHFPNNTEFCNYGSFLDDIDLFDPLFFNISGVEATYTDPQQRIFLEECWNALEDAGYVGAGIQGRLCGIYVGCGSGNYQVGEDPPPQAFWGNSDAVVPARIAYYLDLKGPAVTVNTACSSSLVAIHLACQSLWNNEIELALAGGVFVQSTPMFHLYCERCGMLSHQGRCFTFDSRADGIVIGEGAGAILLKRLPEALADGDHIYGVIRGSGINQDGTTNGITAPSLISQERLERYVYDTFNINPEDIQMVEAHGTGTKLGDPIEYHALTRAFQHYTAKKGFCAIGSIKTNLGHAVTAAGISGMLKVLLSLKYKQIPPSLHFQSGNPNIQLTDSPFYVNTSLREWHIEAGGKRTAAISSFGFSGTNAHIVIEEAPIVERSHPENPGYLIVLSARNFEQLQQQVQQLVAFCEREPQVDCGNMSYTLLLGRKHFNYRLACMVSNQAELIALLNKWLAKGKVPQVYFNELHENDRREQPSLKRFGNQCIFSCRDHPTPDEYREQLSTVAELFVQGYALEFEQLFLDGNYSRISLPTYPFSRQSYWVRAKATAPAQEPAEAIGSNSFIHPLVQRNTSDFFEQRFTSTFTGREFFLTDHVVMGRPVLPGVAYLEMVRAAVEVATGSAAEVQTGVRLKNVVWARPVVIENAPVQVNIGLHPQENGEIAYEVYSESLAGEALLHSQGRAILGAGSAIPALDIDGILQTGSKQSFSAAQCYEIFRKMGISYGPGHQGIKNLYVGDGEVLAELALPSAVKDTQDHYMLHPSLMDSALQASLGLMVNLNDLSLDSDSLVKPYLPFALQEIEIIGGCTAAMWAVIRFSADCKAGDKVQRLDVTLADATGAVCARMKGFTTRALEGENGPPEASDTLVLRRCWTEQPLGEATGGASYVQSLVILCETGNAAWNSAIESRINGARCISLQDEGKAIDERYESYALRVFGEVQQIVTSKPKDQVLIQLVVPLEGERALCSGLFGLLQTAKLEYPKLTGQLIEVESEVDLESLIVRLNENRHGSVKNQIRYRDGKRWTVDWQEIDVLPKEVAAPWKDDGVYLITGGNGGLGLICAREILQKVNKATLILVGRSPLAEDQQELLKQLGATGSAVEYRQVDLAQRPAVNELIKRIRNQYHKLNGIIHCAGVIRDNFILKKTNQEWEAVLAPKVRGVVNLDLATKDLTLDFFIMFSSMVGVMGNFGQADYAAANAFMDLYAQYRNWLVTQKERHGRTLAYNWPLWKEGGMRITAETEKLMRQSLGIAAMDTQTGLNALYQGLTLDQDQIMVLFGNKTQIRQVVATATYCTPLPAAKAPVSQVVVPGNRTGNAVEQLKTDLVKIVSRLLKVTIADIDVNSELSEYGFDSLSFTEFANNLNQEYQLELAPTVFFEHPTLAGLADYLVEAYPTLFGRQDVATQQLVKPDESATSQAGKIPELCDIRSTEPEAAPPCAEAPTSSADTLAARNNNGLVRLKANLVKVVSRLLKVKTEDIDVDTELNEYGFDSLTFTEFASSLNREYRLELAPTVFFEYPTLAGLAEYLVAEYQPLFETPDVGAPKVTQAVEPVSGEPGEKPLVKKRGNRFIDRAAAAMLKPEPNAPELIAIVGMSGRFPMARDLNEFWDNLVTGKDCITEIPEDRWNWRDFYGDPAKEINKTNIKWGGFIDGVAEFDPLFFGISPREAQFMDPQQRLLMTYVWKVIEDAGIAAEQLSGTKTGIFVGTTNSGYSGLISQANIAIEGYTATGMAPSVGPNRMSYFLNLHGPSEPIETACSSSLVAINRAVSAIQSGMCEMAIAGGINTLLTPELYISFNKAGMLCEDGRCKTFSDQANGYVRGEGVGMIFLKKLKEAEMAGDHIYGVIRGIGENHGGRATSLTAPNPKAQAEVLVTAYTRAGINPRTVSYIEAHGTGTQLGDPIEINGLKAAFKELYQASGDPRVTSAHCGLGSVKTNIGHLELAAGIAGVIKVLLQLQHKKLVPSLHCETLNPYIQLKDSPFYIVQEAKEWEALQDEDGNHLPRRAGISSFGFGGVNAHVVIEEYLPEQRRQGEETANPPAPWIIVLSAKHEARLKEQVRGLLTAIELQQLGDADLPDMAYTLQVGREAMEVRLALVVENMGELTEKLQEFIAGNGNDYIPGLYYGQIKRNQESLGVLAADDDMTTTIDAWIAKRKYAKLVDLWVKGLSFDWNKLYGDRRPRRISLPTYPFARDKYWIVGPARPLADDSRSLITQAPQSAPASTVAVYRETAASVLPPGTFPNPITLAPVDLTPPNIADNLDKPSGISLEFQQLTAPASQPITLLPLGSGVTRLERNDTSNGSQAVATVTPVELIQEQLLASLAKLLSLDQNNLDFDTRFTDLGLDSITGVEWIQTVNTQYGTAIPVAKIYDYPNIRQFGRLLAEELKTQGSYQPDIQKFAPANPENTKKERLAAAFLPTPAGALTVSLESILEKLLTGLSEVLAINRNALEPDMQFADLGLDSIIGVEWINTVNQEYGIAFTANKIYEGGTVYGFAQLVQAEISKQPHTLSQTSAPYAPAEIHELIEKVQQGALDIEQADQLLQSLIRGGQNG